MYAALMQAMQAFGEQLMRGTDTAHATGGSRVGSPPRGRAAARRPQRQISGKAFRRCEVFSGNPSTWREWRRRFRTAMKAVAFNVDEALGWVERQGEEPNADWSSWPLPR